MIGNANWKRKLHSLVKNLQEGGKPKSYSLRYIVDEVDAPQASLVVTELTRLLSQGKISAGYRVRSPFTHAGLREFRTLSEIPNSVYDETSDRSFSPELDRDIEIIYRGRDA